MRPFVIQSILTPRKNDRLDRYLLEISHLPMVAPEEEARLARAIRDGNEDALQQLVQANLRFVVTVAKQYQHRGLSLSDLVNEGNVGLIRAARRFDETRGFKFISYAVWWIRQAMSQALADQGRLVRIPSNRVGLNLRLQHAVSKLEQEHHRAPSSEELAEAMGLPEHELQRLQRTPDRHESLDAPRLGNEDATLKDELAGEGADSDHDVMHTESLQIELGRSLAGLSDRDRSILIAFFGIGRQSSSLQEIADGLDMTTERIRQIKDKALRLLRNRSNIDLLRSYL